MLYVVSVYTYTEVYFVFYWNQLWSVGMYERLFLSFNAVTKVNFAFKSEIKKKKNVALFSILILKVCVEKE